MLVFPSNISVKTSKSIRRTNTCSSYVVLCCFSISIRETNLFVYLIVLMLMPRCGQHKKNKRVRFSYAYVAAVLAIAYAMLLFILIPALKGKWLKRYRAQFLHSIESWNDRIAIKTKPIHERQSQHLMTVETCFVIHIVVFRESCFDAVYLYV